MGCVNLFSYILWFDLQVQGIHASALKRLERGIALSGPSKSGKGLSSVQRVWSIDCFLGEQGVLPFYTFCCVRGYRFTYFDIFLFVMGLEGELNESKLTFDLAAGAPMPVADRAICIIFVVLNVHSP